jgi:hypothetical protein
LQNIILTSEGDDQLIPYGLNSTVSIIRSFPSDLLASKVKDVSIEYDKRKKATGVTLKYHDFKGTQYVIKNNSTSKTIPKFYVDHTADTSYGGYVIVTKDRVLKSTTGWTRYQFSLKPQEEITFTVLEEASHQTTLSIANLPTFVSKSAPSLVEEKVLKPEMLEMIKQLIQLNELMSALQQIKSERFTERQVILWKESKAVNESILSKLSSVLNYQSSLEEMARKTSSYEEYIKQVFQNQARLRENIKSMEKVANSSLVERYLKDLNQEEDNLIKSRQSIENLDKQKREVETALKEVKFAVTSEATKLLETLE